MNKLFSLLLLLVVGLLFSFPVNAIADSGEYSKMLDSADIQTRIQAAKLIARDKTFDAQLLKKVETRLLAGYQENTRDRFHADEMAYYCKALGASGNMKYLELLQQVEDATPNRNLKRHAASSQKLLADNAELNKLTSSRKGWDKSLGDAENKQLQMLRSDQYRLKRSAARDIYNNPGANVKLYDVIAEELLAGVKAGGGDRDYMDTMAWFCKALGSSGDPKYRDVLNQVKEETNDRKLQKYADQALNML